MRQLTIGQTPTDSVTMPFPEAGEFTVLSELVRKAKREATPTPLENSLCHAFPKEK